MADDNHGSLERVFAAVRSRRESAEAHGYTGEHDDEHADGSLAMAGAYLAIPDGPGGFKLRNRVAPWTPDWSLKLRAKKLTRKSQLVEAIQLLCAEVERLDRVELAEASASRSIFGPPSEG